MSIGDLLSRERWTDTDAFWWGGGGGVGLVGVFFWFGGGL